MNSVILSDFSRFLIRHLFSGTKNVTMTLTIHRGDSLLSAVGTDAGGFVVGPTSLRDRSGHEDARITRIRGHVVMRIVRTRGYVDLRLCGL